MESIGAYILLVLAWTAYFFLHSAMATRKVKEFIYNYGFSKRSYRLTYSIIFTILLLALFFYNGMVAGPTLFEGYVWTKWVGLMLAGGGFMILRVAFRQYSLGEFLGLKTEQTQGELQRRGILGTVRHPIYTATLLISIGYMLFDPRLPTLVSMACIWIYLPIGIYFEEKKLIRMHGDLYRRYREEVPAIIPWPFK